MEPLTRLTKERLEEVLKLVEPYTIEDFVFAFRDKEAWLANRIADSLRMGDADAHQRHQQYLSALREAFSAFTPQESLPDIWIIGPWGHWGKWLNNERIRTRQVTAQGNPSIESRPDDREVQRREPIIPLPERIKSVVVQAVQGTPAVLLLLLLAWLLFLNVLAIGEML